MSSVVTQVNTVVGAASFQGRSAMQISVGETVQRSGQRDQLFAGKHYLAVSGSAVRLLGTVSTFRVNESEVTQTVSLSAPLPELDFSLPVAVPSSELATATASFQPSGTAGSSFSIASTLQFAGLETVTVPAGTFANACKFVQTVDNGMAVTVTRWIAQGSGVMVRATRDGAVTQELVSASINGTALIATAAARRGAAR